MAKLPIENETALGDYPGCFGFYSHTCETVCPMKGRCKAILGTHGFDVIGSLVKELAESLSEGDYPDTDLALDLVKLLTDGPQYQEKVTAGVFEEL